MNRTWTASLSRFRQARPFVGWIVVSALLLTWQFHRVQASRASISFTVLIEGKKPSVPWGVSLDNADYYSGQPSGVGWKKFRVTSPETEPFETNLFLWYAGRQLGPIEIVRSRGQVELNVVPTKTPITIKDEAGREVLRGSGHASPLLLTGQYLIRTDFAHFHIERKLVVSRSHTNRINIKPALTALSLSADPTNAEFQLTSTRQEEVSIKGSTPIVITELPTGEYQLTIWRDDYEKKLPIQLKAPGGTNEEKVKFTFTTLAVNSDPEGAVVRKYDKVLGRTPVTLSLPPGRHDLRIAKEGFYTTNISFLTSGEESNSVAVTLVNAEYVAALERAREQSSRADYDRALTEVEAALETRPGDETALRLKQSIQFKRHLGNARQLGRDGDYTRAMSAVDSALKLDASDGEAITLKTSLTSAKQEADDRRAKSEQASAAARAETRHVHPQKIFQEVVVQLRFHELFDMQTLRSTGQLDTVQAAVVRALGRDPKWNVFRTEKIDAETAVIQATLKKFASRHDVCIVAGQTSDQEVTVYFKLFEFTLGEHVQLSLSGLSDESFKPLHVKYASPLRAPFVEGQRARDIQEFRKRIEDELK